MSSQTTNIYDDQIARGVFDPFACLGLHATFPHLTTRLIRLHFRVVIKHLFERAAGAALTSACNVPKWGHANRAKDMLSTEDGLRAAISLWAHNSVQTWNPYAEPGSDAAKIPLDTTAGMYRMQL